MLEKLCTALLIISFQQRLARFQETAVVVTTSQRTSGIDVSFLFQAYAKCKLESDFPLPAAYSKEP